MAAHTTLEKASESAFFELVERDIFLCYYLSKTIFPRCEKFFEVQKKLKLELSRYSMDIYFTHLLNHPNLHVIGCSIFKNNSDKFPWGCNIGLGCSSELEKAFNSALSEATRNAILLQKREFITIEQFNKIELPLLEDHGKLRSSQEYANYFINYFTSHESYRKLYNVDLDILSLSLNTSILEILPSNEFSDIPLKFAVASNDLLQELYFGHITSNKVNMDRLKNFTKDDSLSWQSIQKIPHPIT